MNYLLIVALLIIGVTIGVLIAPLSVTCPDLNKIINTLVRQSARWAVAASQDESPMIAVLHANYGAGYLWALKDIATVSQIRSATGIDPLKFRDHIIAIQDQATRRMARLCPEYAPPNSYLATIAGEGA